MLIEDEQMSANSDKAEETLFLEIETTGEAPEVDLKPKKPSKLAPQGIRTFTVCRINDESGVSGTGVIIEGITLATGQCVVHWLYPPPSGAIAIFNSISDFATVHIKPHPGNETIITYEDGEQVHYREDGSVLTKPAPEEEEETYENS
jgi:hypothetical protein